VKKKLITVGVVLAIVAVITVVNMYFAPDRLTPARMEQIRKTAEMMDKAKAYAAEKEAAPAEGKPDAAATPQKTESQETWPESAPDVFKVKFECSNGDIIIECHKDWAPIGVQHFYELVRAGFYDEARFFRVIPGFVVQFGLPADPAMGEKYGKKTLQDDPVKGSNTAGMVTYAKTGAPNSRSSQIFINTGNNAQLDGMGFAPFAKVIQGMDVVNAINPEYRERPDQSLIRARGNDYLNQAFPNLDYIKKAVLTK